MKFLKYFSDTRIPSSKSLWKFKSTIIVLILICLTDCTSFNLDGTTDCNWILPIFSTIATSIVPFLILFLLPLAPLGVELKHDNCLFILLSFASGSLLGDSFFHLIPHAQKTTIEHDPQDDEEVKENQSELSLSVGLWVLIGFVGFLIIEKATGILHSKRQKKRERKTENEVKELMKEMGVAGYLNLIADFLHNFMDGLAIGVSYLNNPTLGMTTTMAVVVHEIPRVIGDITVLVRAGCSTRKAIYLQILTAIGALSGTILSVLVGGKSSDSWMLGLTAGGFIYIGTVSIIPDILRRTQLAQSVKELLGFLTGLLVMYALAVYDQELKNYFMSLHETKEQEEDSVANVVLQKIQQFVWSSEL